MAEFQPIETAPRDGTIIGAWSPREPGIIRRVRWGHHLGMKKHPPTWNTVSRGLAISNVPTHWIPLPPVPGEASDGVSGTLPPHLQDDAPSLQCTRCGRKSWDLAERGLACNMVQPFGGRCIGQMLPAGVAAGEPAWKPEPPCWLVERRAEGRTTGYLGHTNGSYEWMPTPDKATRFVRREDANGVAECIETEDVIVAEHIWG